MARIPLSLALVAALTVTAPALAAEADPVAMIDAMQKSGGKHSGLRPSFAKGLCGQASFQPTAEAAGLSVAPTFQQAVTGTVRLGTAGSTLTASDKAPTARGMSLALQLPDGSEHHFVLSSAPVFVVNDPTEFVAFIEARLPDPATGKPDPAKVKAFGDANPETLRQAAYMKDAPVPASFAHAPFFGVNTFFFTDGAGQRRPARWLVVPTAGVVGLTPEQLQSGPTEFLAEELRSRLASGPVTWDVFLQFPREGDPLEDATVMWPDDRERMKVGTIAVSEVDAAGETGACHAMMFDPLLLPEGIEPSDDPVLLVRSPAYAESLTRRSAP